MNSEKRIEKFKKEKNQYERDLAEIVIKTNQIEALLENLILAELRPDRHNYEFMKDVLFNPAYISLGSKVSLVKNVSVKHHWKWQKEPWNKIYTLLRIRNAFAHTNPIYFESHHRENIEEEGTHIKDILVVENKHGFIDKKSWKKLLKEYREGFDEVYEMLKDKSREESAKWGENVFAKLAR